MIKKSIYPKTERLKVNPTQEVWITEKLDGSNLCFFKLDDTKYIALRNNIITLDEIDNYKQLLYKGLEGWLKENAEEVFNIHNGSAICGEWLGMGNLKYDEYVFPQKFYMFAKANIDRDYTLFNINYYHDFFIYPFVNQEIPECIGLVPIVAKSESIPVKRDLDKLYIEYSKIVNRKVEGFVVNYKNLITKYVRMKNGKLQEHFDWEEK